MPTPVLTASIAKQAVAIVRPAVLSLIGRGVSKRKTLHVVVAVPRTHHSFASLYEETVGEIDRSLWEGPFDAIAQAKCRESWRTGESSSYLVHCAPQRLEVGDTIHWGSDVLDDLVTGCSGDHPFFDEMFAGMVNHAIRALCKQYVIEASAEMRERGEHFFR